MKNLIIAMLFFGLLAFLAFSFSQQKPTREIILTKNAPQPIGPYSQAVKINNTLYVSGQIALTPDGITDTSSIENECAQAMKNVKAIVEAAGFHMNQVTKSTLYVKDLKNFQKINEVYGTFFSSNPPARETIQVSALPKNMHLEISVIAVR